MSELTTNRLWNTAPKDRASQFARMILGTSAIDPRFATTPDVTPIRPADRFEETPTRSARPRTLNQQLLPQTTVDRFTVCELVTADLIILLVVCAVSSLFSPTWACRGRICRSLRFW